MVWNGITHESGDRQNGDLCAHIPFKAKETKSWRWGEGEEMCEQGPKDIQFFTLAIRWQCLLRSGERGRVRGAVLGWVAASVQGFFFIYGKVCQ